ncbi:hypothetical protein V2J83_14630 [Pseudomonas alliivorans]|nr:hypothetical protein [Pseudomonas alliivorans]
MSVTTTERRRRERTLAWRNMIAVQGLLIESLQHPITLQAVADHLSQDGFEYVAALYDLSRTLTTLALSPSNVDPLAPGGTIVDAVTQVGFVEARVSQGQTLLSQITNDSAHPLHLMLWPESDLETVCKPYEVPLDEDKNLGRGVQQLRSMMPEHFGAAFLLKRNRVTAQHYVFGLEDLPTRSTMPNARYGEYLDPNGNPFRDIDPPFNPHGPLTSGDHHVLVIPRSHKTAQLVGDINRKLKTAQEAGHATGKAESAYVRARSGLSQAIENLDATKSGAVYRFLASTRFCVAVLMLEVWNVSSESDAFNQTTREKNKYRASLGSTAAGLDLAIDLEALIVKMSGTKASLQPTRQTLLRITDAGSKRWLGPFLSRALAKEVTARMLAQLISGIALTVLNLWDAWYAWRRNDDAAYGHILIAMGGIAGTLGTAFAGANTFLGLSPLGWIALLLIGTGVGVILLFSSTPLETWLKSGPFGKGDVSDYFLKDPQEAFYRLTSLLAGITIKIEKNPAYEPCAKYNFFTETPHAIRSADTIIRIQSYLPGLISRLESLDINTECRLGSVITRSSREGIPYQTEIQAAEKKELPKAQRLHPDGLELFFRTPTNPTISIGDTKTSHLTWVVRAQFVMSRGDEKRVFPAPSPSDPIQYNLTYAKPDFSKVNQPLWADEETFKARSHE